MGSGLDDLARTDTENGLAGLLIVQELLTGQGRVGDVGVQMDLLLDLDLDDGFRARRSLGVDRGRR